MKMQLQRRLSEFALAAPQMGEAVSGALAAQRQPEPEQLSTLHSDVSKISSSNGVYFKVCFGSVVLLFIAEGISVVAFSSDPDKLKAILAVTGVSFFALIARMLKFWKEKVQSDITLALIASLRPEDVRPTLEIMLKGFK